MKEYKLKYGCNPNQKPARIFMKKGKLPVKILNGNPGFINFLDALNGYQLVRELHEATGHPAAASFKHVSPAGAAIGLPLSEIEEKMFFVANMPLSPLAVAYARARGADRVCSYGDWAALSDICDEETASIIAPEVSDGIIAPGYTDAALRILKKKRKGGYGIVEIDPNYAPRPQELKDVYGITFEQGRNDVKITNALFDNIVTENKILPESAKLDLLVALITLKYTQSNSVCYAVGGQAIGVGAGQQSRIHCTGLAGSKADKWFLRHHPDVINLPFKNEVARPVRDNVIDIYISGDEASEKSASKMLREGAWQTLFTEKPRDFLREEREKWIAGIKGVALGSDAFFPFGDNIERAKCSGVLYIAQPGGSIRDGNVIEICDKYNMVMAFTDMRLFHH
ncbi:MAG: phosphoribosylaminoimidazolecarboxamide formyltransferase [Oscillospiraceae bacterium]|nr:phosphoribosylaminoimidazolecarboxamide formyltransferase [Oscillospiraceae bacterium]